MKIDDFMWVRYQAAGTLFWTSDSYGNAWVLLARRKLDSIFGKIYSYSIPVTEREGEECMIECAARAAHDELGLMPSPSSINEFWSVDSGNISLKLYSQRVSSMKTPKCNGAYWDARWFCLPDDCRIEDGDFLLCEELQAFHRSLKLQKAAV